MKKIIVFMAMLVALVSLSGCRVTKYVDKPVKIPYTVRDTVKSMAYAIDTIYNRDSVYVNGQTVYKEKWRFKIQIRHDTIYKNRVDTIGVPVYLNKETKIEIPWYNKVFIHIGRICLLVGLIGLGTYLIRFYLKKKLI